jgi:3-methylfumaryl-CoA hydratase
VPGEAAAASTTPPGESTWSRLIKPSPVLLFRYSALTFNSHRIHYDRSYAEREEGYHGLVVHGPLIATLLVDLLRRQLPGARLREFSFRALRPLIDTDDFMLCAAPQEDGTVRLWAQDSGGQVATHATARYNAEQKES